MTDSLTEERRLGGAGMRITPAERREIAIAYLTDPELGSISACAKHFTRTREAVSGCLRGNDFEALRKQVDHEASDEAKTILRRARVKAAKAWVDTAIEAAADRGDHKPSKDLLIATQVIEPAPPEALVVVQIGVRDGDVQVMFQPPRAAIHSGGNDVLPDDVDVQLPVHQAPAIDAEVSE